MPYNCTKMFELKSSGSLNLKVIYLRRKVRFEKDDELSRAVQRLDALSAYDKELDEWNSLKSSQNDRYMISVICNVFSRVLGSRIQRRAFYSNLTVRIGPLT